MPLLIGRSLSRNITEVGHVFSFGDNAVRCCMMGSLTSTGSCASKSDPKADASVSLRMSQNLSLPALV